MGPRTAPSSMPVTHECPWHGAITGPTCPDCPPVVLEPPRPVDWWAVTGRCHLCGVLVEGEPATVHRRRCGGPGEPSPLDPMADRLADLLGPALVRLWLAGGWS